MRARLIIKADKVKEVYFKCFYDLKESQRDTLIKYIGRDCGIIVSWNIPQKLLTKLFLLDALHMAGNDLGKRQYHSCITVPKLNK